MLYPSFLNRPILIMPTLVPRKLKIRTNLCIQVDPKRVERNGHLRQFFIRFEDKTDVIDRKSREDETNGKKRVWRK